MSSRLHPCPECSGVPLVTRERKGSLHLECPVCHCGTVFCDARGGFECSACDQRFLIHHESPYGYGGPEHVGGPLRWWERPATGWQVAGLCAVFALVLWLLPPGTGAVLFLAQQAVEYWRETGSMSPPRCGAP